MRLRHFRGRKVHSPFVYGIVRECLMPRAGRTTGEQIAAVFDYIRKSEVHSGEAVCILSHRKNRRARREIVERHDGTSFETRRFLCVISDERLPKQHYKL